MSWKELYQIFAEDLSNSVEDPPMAKEYVYNSLLALTNSVSEDDGRLIETTFLYDLNRLYEWSRRFSQQMDPKVRQFAYRMNVFTIKYYGDLTTFVNSIPWHEDCIPFYWWTTSEDMDFDTSEWIGCSS